MNKNLILLALPVIIFLFQSQVFLKTEDNFSEPEDYFNFIEENIFTPAKIKDASFYTSAESVSAVVFEDGENLVLYSKNIEEQLPIASLTKLMTAVVALENYALTSKVEISQRAEETYGTSLEAGDIFSVQDLMYLMLIESSNDASEAITEKLGRDNFIYLMNKKAKELKMKSTVFVNPSGLEDGDGECNVSSAKDLTKLLNYIIENHPLVPEILSYAQFDLYKYDGSFFRTIESTNEMLGEMDVWGKTGYTEKARGCLVLMTKTPKEDIIINIVLGAGDRFLEMRSLINWTNNVFIF